MGPLRPAACHADRSPIRAEFEDGFLRSELETRLLHIQPGEIVLQGNISGPTQRVVSYLMMQEATSSGLAGSGRVDQPQKPLSSAKAASLISDFYKQAVKDDSSLEDPSEPKKNRKKAKEKAVIDLSDGESDHAMAIDLTEDDQPEGADGAALAAVLALPERVM